MSKMVQPVIGAEKHAEIREAWNLIAEKKVQLRKKEVFKVLRALGIPSGGDVPTECFLSAGSFLSARLL